MFEWLKKIRDDAVKQEQTFMVVVFVMSIILAFLFGYLVFRYEKLEICRTEIEVLPEINPVGKS